MPLQHGIMTSWNDGDMRSGRFLQSQRRLIAGVVSALLFLLPACGTPGESDNSASGGQLSSQESTSDSHGGQETSRSLVKNAPPEPDESLATPEYKARQILESMSLQERIGQLVMAPLNLQTASSLESIQRFIQKGQVGSVLLLGNWNNGTASLAEITKKLQGFAPRGRQLLIAADQEGGQVQHLRGTGFTRMPSALTQGSMTTAQLQQQAGVWGQQLKSAGVNVNLAPVVGTVQVKRSANAPIGALQRDFGHNGTTNAQYAAAFIAGMRQAGVMTSIKHYPGLGAVTGNTDFTAEGTIDSTTVIGGEEEGAFATALKADPDIVMMALATYSAIDSSVPAAFSSKIINGRLRGELGFEGVVTSDSLSAAAVQSIPSPELGVRFVSAGGDLVCVGDPGIAQKILDGLNAKAKESKSFRELVDRSAVRVLALKIERGLVSSAE
ncbi:MAG: beta-glucosidase [Bifidobacteriaceae bacterium]|jgi:beta-N-acetylhexosaminidase|nr:beta-glucosidase [Bifidobacteriaceae bacterium]MCI1978898.1 beta-glucosidase [Bifidobacteriaceae bacterium]